MSTREAVFKKGVICNNGIWRVDGVRLRVVRESAPMYVMGSPSPHDMRRREIRGEFVMDLNDYRKIDVKKESDIVIAREDGTEATINQATILSWGLLPNGKVACFLSAEQITTHAVPTGKMTGMKSNRMAAPIVLDRSW